MKYDRNIENSRKTPKRVNPYINQATTPANPNAVGANPAQDGGIASNFNSNDFLKGALIGAGVTFLLTNKSVQKGLFKTFAKGSQMFQMGMEEMKERMEDAKYEMEAQNHHH